MKSNAPWSVKGIERDARETAKEAAKREGMTVGEWLNQMIYSAGDPVEAAGGEVEGLKLTDIVTAIDHLHQRIAESHAESAATLKDVTRKVGEVVERVQRLERIKPAEGTNEDLAVRVEKLERSGGDRDRIDALKALEKAVTQVAVQFNSAQKTSLQRLDATEQQLQEFAERLDHVGAGDASDAGHLQSAVEKLAVRIAKVEKLAGEAATISQSAEGSTDPEFIQNTSNRLRVLGDEIKRGGDQIRTLEATIGKLSDQIDAAERRSAEGVQKVAETLAELRESFSGDRGDEPNRADIDAVVAAATKETDDRIEALQKSFETMIARLDALGEGGKAEIAAAPQAEDESVDHDGEMGAPVDTPLSAAMPLVAGKPSGLQVLRQQHVASDDDDDTAAMEDDAVEAEAAEEDDDTDPFAFADDIEAAFDDAPDSDASDDDFNFELEDEPEEIEQFGKRAVEMKTPEAAPETPAAGSTSEADDDLNQILADLDELTGVGAADETADDDDEDDQPLFGASKKATVTADAPQKPEAEGKEKSETGAIKTRRNLTPKQKAILAARARQKRLAAAKTEPQKAADAKKLAAAKEALQSAASRMEETEARDEDDEESRASRIKSAIASIKGKLPFIGGNEDEDEDDAGETAKAPEKKSAKVTKPSKNDDKAPFDTLKSTVAARPVTLALAVAIILSVGVLFMLVKDFIFDAPDGGDQRSIASTATPTDTTTLAGGDSAENALEVPAPPAVDPKVLYRDAMTGLGAAETQAETAAAMSKLEEAAALGHPPAQLQLGEFYKTGQGVEQDLGQARTWFRRAANGGNVLAMHRIGVMTARGDGGPADANEAISWFELAANYGLVDSQYNLGAIFHPSAEGPSSSVQDAGKAYYWYSLAAKNGDDQAAPLAESVAAALTPAQRSEIDSTVNAWEALPSDDAANELVSGT